MEKDEGRKIIEANLVGECYLKDNKNCKNVEMICDLGATEHMVNSTEYFSNIISLTKPINISSANSKAPIQATKKGSFISRLDSGKIVKINQILFSEKLSKNLLSLRKLVCNGTDVLLTGHFDGRFWKVNFKIENNVGDESVECFINEEINVQCEPFSAIINNEHSYAAPFFNNNSLVNAIANEHNYSSSLTKSSNIENEGSKNVKYNSCGDRPHEENENKNMCATNAESGTHAENDETCTANSLKLKELENYVRIARCLSQILLFRCT